MIDTDPQGGLTGWWNARQADAPELLTVPRGRELSEVIGLCRGEGYDLVLVDTPPSIAPTIAGVMAVAQLIVIPVRPSPNDLRAVGSTVDMAVTGRKPMVFVVSQATQRARITAEAAIALSQYGTVAPVMVHHRVDFATSMTDGRTAGELDPTSRSATEIAALWDYLSNRLTQEVTYAETSPRPAQS